MKLQISKKSFKKKLIRNSKNNQMAILKIQEALINILQIHLNTNIPSKFPHSNICER